MKEKSFENKVRAYLKSVGAYNVKYLGCAITQSGVPDVLACVNGKFVAIELKGDNGHASNLQLANLKRIDQAGGFAVLLFPEHFDGFKLMIEQILADTPKATIVNSLKFAKFLQMF